jgi:hypothetical protein
MLVVSMLPAGTVWADDAGLPTDGAVAPAGDESPVADDEGLLLLGDESPIADDEGLLLLEEGAAPSDDYSSLLFNEATAFQGTVTLPASANFTEDLVYKVYRVESYVTKPVIGQNWAGMWGPPVPSEDYFRMYIYVPVSYGGVDLSAIPDNERPIMFKVNWGGDMSTAPSGMVTPMDDAPVMALSKGWVVVDPGMLGVNCTSEGPNGEPVYNYGKAPYPIASLKAAVRYLRYGTNTTAIPGDKEKIFATGTSSGGCGTVMLAASGNTTLFDDALAVLGAAPGRDDIYGTLASCPIIPRDYSDQAIAFLRFFWLDFDTVDTSTLTADQQLGLSVNKALVQSFEDYVPSLGLVAERTVGSVNKGDAITTDNILEYFYPYLKQSCVTYLNALGDRAAIDTYIAESRGAAPGMVRSTLIDPVFAADGTTVIDLNGDFLDIWKLWIDYVYQVPGFGGNIDGTDPTVVDYLFDKPYISPNIQDNGVLDQADAAPFSTVGSRTFGKPTDWATTYSPFGLDWIVEKSGKTVSQEYRDLYRLQCLSMDPMYFIRNAEALGVDVAPHWFIRTGAADTVALPAMFLSLTTTLENRGYDVNAALTWDQGHGPTNEWPLFFEWQATLVDESPVDDPDDPDPDPVDPDSPGTDDDSTIFPATGDMLAWLLLASALCAVLCGVALLVARQLRRA